MTKNNDADSEEKNKSTLWKIAIFVVIALYWISIGTPNPMLYLNISGIKKECEAFAEENLDGLAILAKAENVRVGDTWIVDGRRVVELIYTEVGSGDWGLRLCVYGKGTISIPGILMQGRWMG